MHRKLVTKDNQKLFHPSFFAKKKTKTLQSKNDVDGALNKYKLIDAESQKGAEIWNNVGLCFYKKKKFIAVFQKFCFLKNARIRLESF